MKDEDVSQIKSILWDLLEVLMDHIEGCGLEQQRIQDIQRKMDRLGRVGK